MLLLVVVFRSFNHYSRLKYLRPNVMVDIDCTMRYVIIIIIILSFGIAPFPYKHAQRPITFHCQRIDVDIHIVN